MDMIESLNALRDKVAQSRGAIRSQKAEDWAKVKQSAPEHAALIQAVSAGFGKPAAVRVVVMDETILDTRRYD